MGIESHNTLAHIIQSCLQLGKRKEIREQGMRKTTKSKKEKGIPRHIRKTENKIKSTKEGRKYHNKRTKET
jgi:hypothetical protein